MKNSKNLPVLLITYIRKKNIKKLIKILDNSEISKIYIYSNYINKDNDLNKLIENRFIIKSTKTRKKKIIYFADKHRPVHYSIPHAISWFFSIEKHGIILEDDCIPNNQFVEFCTNNINKLYTNNFMLISGNRFSPKNNDYNNSYYSYFFHGWGWATTNSNWKLFNNYYKEKKNINKLNIRFPKFNKNTTKLYWKNIFYLIMKKRLFSWDYMIQKFMFEKKKYSIIPNKNLVKNNGIDKFAQNTFKKNSLNDLEKNFKLRKVNLSQDTIYDEKNDLWEEKMLYGSIKSLISNYVKKKFF